MEGAMEDGPRAQGRAGQGMGRVWAGPEWRINGCGHPKALKWHSPELPWPRCPAHLPDALVKGTGQETAVAVVG